MPATKRDAHLVVITDALVDGFRSFQETPCHRQHVFFQPRLKVALLHQFLRAIQTYVTSGITWGSQQHTHHLRHTLPALQLLLAVGYGWLLCQALLSHLHLLLLLHPRQRCCHWKQQTRELWPTTHCDASQHAPIAAPKA